MKIKTADLTGPALDWAVLTLEQSEDAAWYLDHKGRLMEEHGDVSWVFTPSTNWAQGGPIIEREEIGVRRNAPCSKGQEWEAMPSITAKGAGGRWCYGPTPLIAAMRCYVASRLGDEVDIPKELI